MIGTRDTPASRATFASTLVDFRAAQDALDLQGVRYVSGATATLSGGKLLVTDGAYSAWFKLSGAEAATYEVTADSQGGTLIEAISPQVQAMAQAMASFAPSTAPHAISLTPYGPTSGAVPLIASASTR